MVRLVTDFYAPFSLAHISSHQHRSASCQEMDVGLKSHSNYCFYSRHLSQKNLNGELHEQVLRSSTPLQVLIGCPAPQSACLERKVESQHQCLNTPYDCACLPMSSGLQLVIYNLHIVSCCPTEITRSRLVITNKLLKLKNGRNIGMIGPSKYKQIPCWRNSDASCAKLGVSSSAVTWREKVLLFGKSTLYKKKLSYHILLHLLFQDHTISILIEKSVGFLLR